MLHYLRSPKVLLVLALLVIGIMIGIAHNRALSGDQGFFLEDAARTIVKPFQTVVSGVRSFFGGIKGSLRSRKAVRSENVRLRSEVKELRTELIRLREDAAKAERLEALLNLKDAYPERLIPARVISRHPSEWFVSATINRGRSDGVVPGQAVVTHLGLVGQVFESSSKSALVRGMTDSRSGVGAIVQRSRAVGICRGQDSEFLDLTYLAKDADVQVGDVVVTSGEGGVFPKGLPIGRILKVRMESGGFMKSAVVRPSVRIDNVEEVAAVQKAVE